MFTVRKLFQEFADKLVECLNRAALASDYYSAQEATYEYTQADLDAYYAENKNTLE